MKYSENACALKDQRIALDWDWRPSPNRVCLDRCLPWCGEDHGGWEDARRAQKWGTEQCELLHKERKSFIKKLGFEMNVLQF